jgi:hypothetical protein
VVKKLQEQILNDTKNLFLTWKHNNRMLTTEVVSVSIILKKIIGNFFIEKNEFLKYPVVIYALQILNKDFSKFF